MKMKPIIGLTTYGRNEKNQFNLYAEYVEAVIRAGGVPVLIPPGIEEFDSILPRLDGVILTGGGDIDPQRYRGNLHETIYMLDQERDDAECGLAKRLLDTAIPVFAICRGMQIVNVVLNGTLEEHLPDTYGEKIPHRLPPREPVVHDVQIKEKNCTLASIITDNSFPVVSWHHQAIKKIGDGLLPTAYAEDGVIEAMELPSHRWFVCVQWHPEMSAAEDSNQQALFDRLVAVSRER